MLISEIIYNLYVNKDLFNNSLEEQDNIEVTKMHNYYFLEKGYTKLKEYLKNGKDCGIIVRILATRYDDDYVQINKIPHHTTDKPLWQNEYQKEK